MLHKFLGAMFMALAAAAPAHADWQEARSNHYII
jgi:hypothetical protein